MAICLRRYRHQWNLWQNFPPVALKLVANLPSVSLIPAAILPSVSLTPEANLPLVSLIPLVHLNLQISQNDPNVIFRGLGEGDSWKNLKQKVMLHCPFKESCQWGRFLDFFNNSVGHRFLTQLLKPFWLWHLIPGDIHNRKLTPRYQRYGESLRNPYLTLFSKPLGG